ncbi:MAG TPA: long-chain fatty acid--CoA ligase [Actinomycetes bacterium]|nr:long-chain fatty acid--CoA ligase [Actinomycetes bacterium]
MTLTHTGSVNTVLPARAPSVGAAFLERVKAAPDADAFRSPQGDGEPWRVWSWRETETRVRALAGGLLSLGLQIEQRVAIASTTRLEWIWADLAIMLAGGATTTVYPSTQTDDVAYILQDSESVVVFAEDDTQIAKLRERRHDLPDVHTVVVFDGTPDGEWVISLDELKERGEKYLVEHPSALEEIVASLTPDSLATLVYTSGTTGRPKGVELTHGAWTYEGAAVESLNLLRHDQVQFLWLPLSHVFGKVLLAAQWQIGFSTAVDGRVERIIDNLEVIKPSFMAAAPRIFEKVYTRIVSTTEAEGGVKAKIFDWAFRVGLDVVNRQTEGRSVPPQLKAQQLLADRLVFSKIRSRMGGKVEYFVSGSAALSPEIARWFLAAGLIILEGYGLTETAAGSCVNLPTDFRIGTVGRPLPGTEVKLAEDGEILIKGPAVMRAYHNHPDQTAEVLSADGWFATGDVGEIDPDGKVRITDRKKDLVKTSGGKYIVPSAIESAFKALCPIASQMVVQAEGRHFATALVTIDPDAMQTWAHGQGLDASDPAKFATGEAVRSHVARSIEELNSRLNRWETIKDFRVLEHDLTVEAGELTPSLKVKRKVVSERYAAVIAEMYVPKA